MFTPHDRRRTVPQKTFLYFFNTRHIKRMRILVVLSFIACILVPGSANAQSSGWADSAGYKQQIMPLKSIMQVQYSPGGDTLYTVSRDSLYRIDHWDAVTGKLLKRQTIVAKKLVKMLSVTLSMDRQTYVVCGTESTNTLYFLIYSMTTDSLMFEIKPQRSFVNNYSYVDCSGDVETSLGIITIYFTLVDNQQSPNGPSGSRNGQISRYKIQDTTLQLIGTHLGAVKKVAYTPNKNIYAWVSYQILKRYFRGGLIYHSESMNYNCSMNDSLVIQNELQFEWEGSNVVNSDYALSYYPVLSPDGAHCFFIEGQHLHQWSVAPFAFLSTKNIGFSSTYVLAEPEGTHVMFVKGKTLYFYHIASSTMSDTFQLTSPPVMCAFRPNTREMAYCTAAGNLCISNVKYRIPSIRTTFTATHTLLYKDSTTVFSVVRSKKYRHYEWNFGDGTLGKGEVVPHIYQTSGTYTIVLIATDSLGQSDTIERRDYVRVLPMLEPRFTGSIRYGNAPLTTQFTDESLGAISSWEWNFDDGTKDTVPHPKHTFQERRYYSITLKISDGLSTKVLTKFAFVNADTMYVNTVRIQSRLIDATENLIRGILGSYQSDELHKNKYTKGGLTAAGDLIVYRSECYIRVGSHGVGLYYPEEGIIFISADGKRSSTFYSQLAHHAAYADACDYTFANPGQMIIRPRDGSYVSSFNPISWLAPSGQSPHGIYISKVGFFKPIGWSSNFDAAFLPNGNDIYVFRTVKGTIIDFFKSDTILIARDSMVGEVMKPLVSSDSQQVSIISNLYSGTGDSARWIVQRTYSSAGQLLEEKHILKNISNVRLMDAASLGWGEFLLSGWVTTTDSLGVRRDSAYLAKLGSDGRLAWEYLTPTWRQFKKVEKLSTGHYAVWGIPQDGFNHGFVAVKSDGTILSDNRLIGAQNEFSPSDFVVGAGTNSLWFIGSENVPNQGQRGAVYFCTNPMSAVTSVAEGESSYGFPASLSATVYPQPAVHSMTVRLTAPRGGKVRVAMVSALGTEQVYPEEEVEAGTREFMISTAALSTGMYTLCLRMDGEMCVRPVVVVR